MTDSGFQTVGVYTELRSAIEGDSSQERFAQLHFNHTAKEIELIRETGRKVISVINIGVESKPVGDYPELRNAADLVLLEDKNGISNSRNLSNYQVDGKTGFAGKISFQNLESLVTRVPGFIDASSSLEISPGIKDEKKLKQFLRVARDYK